MKFKKDDDWGIIFITYSMIQCKFPLGVRAAALNICGWTKIFVLKQCSDFCCTKTCHVTCGLLGVIPSSTWCAVWSLKLVILTVHKMVGLKCGLDKMPQDEIPEEKTLPQCLLFAL